MREFTKEQFLAMKRGKSVEIPIDGKTTGQLWLLQMEISSMNNLFESYVQKNGQPIDNFNLDEFLGRYTGASAQYTALISCTIREKLGEEIAQLLLCPLNGFACFFNPTPKVPDGFLEGSELTGNILIAKQCPPPCFWRTEETKS